MVVAVVVPLEWGTNVKLVEVLQVTVVVQEGNSEAEI